MVSASLLYTTFDVHLFVPKYSFIRLITLYGQSILTALPHPFREFALF